MLFISDILYEICLKISYDDILNLRTINKELHHKLNNDSDIWNRLFHNLIDSKLKVSYQVMNCKSESNRKNYENLLVLNKTECSKNHKHHMTLNMCLSKAINSLDYELIKYYITNNPNICWNDACRFADSIEKYKLIQDCINILPDKLNHIECLIITSLMLQQIENLELYRIYNLDKIIKKRYIKFNIGRFNLTETNVWINKSCLPKNYQYIFMVNEHIVEGVIYSSLRTFGPIDSLVKYEKFIKKIKQSPLISEQSLYGHGIFLTAVKLSDYKTIKFFIENELIYHKVKYHWNDDVSLLFKLLIETCKTGDIELFNLFMFKYLTTSNLLKLIGICIKYQNLHLLSYLLNYDFKYLNLKNIEDLNVHIEKVVCKYNNKSLFVKYLNNSNNINLYKVIRTLILSENIEYFILLKNHVNGCKNFDMFDLCHLAHSNNKYLTLNYLSDVYSTKNIKGNVILPVYQKIHSKNNNYQELIKTSINKVNLPFVLVSVCLYFSYIYMN